MLGFRKLIVSFCFRERREWELRGWRRALTATSYRVSVLLFYFGVLAMLGFRELDVSASVSPLARRLGDASLVF